MSDVEPGADDLPNEQEHADRFLALYDEALPQVYGYLLRRCPTVALAEDLTSETFMAAVASIRRGAVRTVTVAWLITIARNKLVDHWRRHEREQRGLQLVQNVTPTEVVDEWADVYEPEAGRARYEWRPGDTELLGVFLIDVQIREAVTGRHFSLPRPGYGLLLIEERVRP